MQVEPNSTGAYFRSYRYEHFAFAFEREEVSYFTNHAPRLGTIAPDFESSTAEGCPIRLADVPQAPLVIEFGSFTCPIFTGRILAMEALAREYGPMGVTFLVIYTREAHPGERTPQPSLFEEKRANALRLLSSEGITRTILVDGIDGPTHLRYGGGYNSVFVLDGHRRIVLRRYWNEPSDVRRVLADLLAGTRPVPFGSVAFGSPCQRLAPGLEILQRGGRVALEDFWIDAPRGIRFSLINSHEDVRKVIRDFESANHSLHGYHVALSTTKS